MKRAAEKQAAEASTASRNAGAPAAARVGLAIAGAAGLGAAAAAWVETLARGFGQAPDTVVTLGSVAAASVAIGTFVDFRPASGPGPRPGRAAGWKLAGLGLLTAVAAPVAPFVPAVLRWAGVPALASEAATTLARLVVGGVLILPAGLLAGAAVRAAARELPAGRAASLVMGVAGAIGLGGALAGRALASAGAPGTVAVAAGIVLAGVGLVAAALHPGRHTPSLAPDGTSGDGRASAWAAGATVFGVAAFAFLATRILVPAFGNDVPGHPVARTLFLAGLAAGALAATAARFLPRVTAGAGAAGAALVLGAVAAIPTIYARFDELPNRFAAAVAGSDSYPEVLALADRMTASVVVTVALLLGAAGGLLLGSLPPDPHARPGWIARSARAGAIGAILGLALPRLALGSLGLGGGLLLAAGALAFGGALAFARGGARRTGRSVAAGLALAAGIVAVQRLPSPDRRALQVEADIVPAGSLVPVAQKHWTVYDRDGVLDTFTVLKRGHARRLLVNGRLDAGDVSELKSHGLLVHLPLVLQAAPKRVCLLGAGNGRSAAAALSHPIESLDVFIPDGAAIGALRHFGPANDPALADERLHFARGDLRDLLMRSDSYDLIASHPSGGWSALSGRVSTREFLTLVRDRLTDRGLYTQCVQTTSLTKEGFLVLLRTVSDVFPQVEVWAGQGGDVVLLAKKTARPHDFRVLLEPFRDPRTALSLRESWLADPVTLLSQFLIGDEAVRRLSSRSAVCTRRNPVLAANEAARRIVSGAVNPVPGLAELRGDVTRDLANSPGAELTAAVDRAVRARDLERAGVAQEIQAYEGTTGQTSARIAGLTEAAETYERGLDLNPRDGALRRALAGTRSAIGIAYSDKLAFTAAYSNMLQAVTIDSTYAEGFGNLGLLLMENDDFDYADATTAQALELAPDDDLLYHQRARIWKRRRFYDRALPYYEKAMEINPLNVEAAMGYSDARLSMDAHPDLEGNLEFLLSYRKLEPDNEELAYRISKLRSVMAKGLEQAREEEGPPPEEELPMLQREIEEPDTTGPASSPDG